MDEYPDPDEEYDLLHQEEMEAMKEMEEQMLLEYYDSRPRKSKNSLNFDSPPLDELDEEIQEDSSKRSKILNIDDQMEKSVTLNGYNKRKRCLSSESLMGISSDLEVIERPPKKHKNTEYYDSTNRLDPCYEFGTTSIRVPKWPFMPVNNGFGERIYVKVNNGGLADISSYFSKIKWNRSSHMLLPSYANIKHLAKETLKELQRNNDPVNRECDLEEESVGGSDLWVEKYKPKTYFDLLSDEAVNRTLLNWLKMWDKAVFNKEPKIKPLKSVNNEKNELSNIHKELDSHGRPFYKIALLCGPPGLGKTTLAHVVAGLAGYNTIEVNASDDRTVEAFSSKLDAATKMKSVMGSCKPNCLILDEIDGAPAPTIEFLLKYLNGKVNEKSKKDKKEKGSGVVKRPVICICNELYTPSLRQLRQQAFVVHFPQTSSTKLAQRLLEICRKQEIKTDLTTLTILCDKAQNDIRSCISTLHFFKIKNGQRFKSTDVIKSIIGQKDIQKGVFNMWKEIFHIPVRKTGLFLNTLNKATHEEISSNINYSKKGMDKLQYIVQMCQHSGDYDRLIQGVYENFLKSKSTGTIGSVVSGLEWFSWFDLLDTSVKKYQNYMLLPYLPYSFAAWHLLFSSNTFWKITYPSAGYENHVKETRCKQILSDVLRGLEPSLRCYSQRNVTLLDVLPMFNVILLPSFRPVNPTLFNDKERKDFKDLLDVMIDYNLTFIQQRSPDGTYFYQLDPNIDDLTRFNLTNQSNSRSFSYNTKQMISHEVELERLRRNETNQETETTQDVNGAKGKEKGTVQKAPTAITNPTVKPKEIKTKESEAQYKDFFGRVVKVKEGSSSGKRTGSANSSIKSPIWFSFKEGYNNAVKKDITMSDLL